MKMRALSSAVAVASESRSASSSGSSTEGRPKSQTIAPVAIDGASDGGSSSACAGSRRRAARVPLAGPNCRSPGPSRYGAGQNKCPKVTLLRVPAFVVALCSVGVGSRNGSVHGSSSSTLRNVVEVSASVRRARGVHSSGKNTGAGDAPDERMPAALVPSAPATPSEPFSPPACALVCALYLSAVERINMRRSRRNGRSSNRPCSTGE